MKPQTSQLTCKDEVRNMLSNEKWNHKHDNEQATMDLVLFWYSISLICKGHL